MGTGRYEVERNIEAPATTVWELLTDAERYGEWNEAVISLEGPIREGERIRLVSIADPKRTFKLRVEEMTEPTKMVWSDGMPLGLFTGRRTYTVNDAGAGRCRFSMVEAFTGPLAGLITKAIPDLTDSFELFAESLKATAETRAANRAD